jgi:hypothetical protein
MFLRPEYFFAAVMGTVFATLATLGLREYFLRRTSRQAPPPEWLVLKAERKELQASGK